MCAAPKKHPPYNKNGEGGRPKQWTVQEIEKMADEFLDWLEKPNSVWFKDFCLQRGLNPDLLSEWAKKNVRFAGVYKMAKHHQEAKMLKGGLLNQFNSSLVKLVLTNHHGWIEKSETKVSGDVVNPLSAILTVIDGTSKKLVEDEE